MFRLVSAELRAPRLMDRWCPCSWARSNGTPSSDRLAGLRRPWGADEPFLLPQVPWAAWQPVHPAECASSGSGLACAAALQQRASW